MPSTVVRQHAQLAFTAPADVFRQSSKTQSTRSGSMMTNKICLLPFPLVTTGRSRRREVYTKCRVVPRRVDFERLGEVGRGGQRGEILVGSFRRRGDTRG